MQNNVTILTITKHMYSMTLCMCVCELEGERVKESYSKPGFVFKYPDCKSTMSFCQLKKKQLINYVWQWQWLPEIKLHVTVIAAADKQKNINECKVVKKKYCKKKLICFCSNKVAH